MKKSNKAHKNARYEWTDKAEQEKIKSIEAFKCKWNVCMRLFHISILIVLLLLELLFWLLSTISLSLLHTVFVLCYQSGHSSDITHIYVAYAFEDNPAKSKQTGEEKKTSTSTSKPILIISQMLCDCMLCVHNFKFLFFFASWNS